MMSEREIQAKASRAKALVEREARKMRAAEGEAVRVAENGESVDWCHVARHGCASQWCAFLRLCLSHAVPMGSREPRVYVGFAEEDERAAAAAAAL